MRISIFGSGYVGLVQAAVFSEVGHTVTCMDIDPARIERIQGGDLPFYEPGLNDLVQAGIAQNTLRFTLAVYRAELFPTGNRSRAAGLLTVAALLGGIGGLLGAGALLDQGWDYRSVMAVLMIGQLIAVVLVLTGLPETAQRELEDISSDR